MKKIIVELLTPEASILKTEADQVTLQGKGGDLGILPGHEPFLAQLKAGEVRIMAGNTVKTAEVSGGFAEILPHSVKVFAPSVKLSSKS
jgi:F-type H+-transporting ATPase subunit epsilon